MKDCHPDMKLIGILNVKAKIGTDRLSKNHFFSSCSYNSQLASWHLQLTDFSEDGGPLTVDLRGFLRQQHHFLAPASITSWDVLPSITSAGDLSAHHFLPKPALLPSPHSQTNGHIHGVIQWRHSMISNMTNDIILSGRGSICWTGKLWAPG